VLFKGKFTIGLNAYINPQNWTDMDCYQAEFHKDYPSATTSILKAENVTKIRIRGGVFHGHDDDGNTANDDLKGIYINNNDLNMPELFPTVELTDVTVRDCYGNLVDIQLSASDGMSLNKVISAGSTRRAFDLKGGDSEVDGCVANSFRENFCITGGTFKVSNCYFGGDCGGATSNASVYVYDDMRSQFVNCLVDAFKKNAFYIKDSNYIHVVTTRIRATDNLSANNTWSGFILENSEDCIIDASYSGRWSSSVTDFLKYGLEEKGTSDYNMISDSNFRHVGTAGIVLVGANSKVSDSWNGTTWIN